jgi:hypothetical protein
MIKRSPLTSVSSMMESVMARHGIGKQVMSAQVVRRANMLLAETVPPEMLADIKVLSLKDGVITLACRNNVAMYDAEILGKKIARGLEEEFPSLSLTAIARLRPEAFNEVY